MTSGETSDGSADRERTPRRLLLVLRRLVICAAILAMLPLGVAAYIGHRLSSNLVHVHGVFDPLSNRPPRQPGATDTVNVVVLTRSSSTQGPTSPWGEAVMLLHLDADRTGAWVVAIPSATRVTVPGLGRRAIGSTFSIDTPSAVVGAVERLTGVRVDHLAVVDWAVLGQLVDASGGIDVEVAAPTSRSGVTRGPSAGIHHLGGGQTVAYSIGRISAGAPALDRLARQQAVLRTLMQTALHQEMRKDPGMLFKFLDTVTRGLTVDSGWSLMDMGRLAFSLRSFRSAQLQFLTLPMAHVAHSDRHAGLHPAQPAARSLWQAVARDDIAAWVASHPRWAQPS